MKFWNIIGSSYCIYCWLFLILYPHFNLTCLSSLRRLCRDHQALPSTNSAPSAGLISRKGRLHLFMISLICLSVAAWPVFICAPPWPRGPWPAPPPPPSPRRRPRSHVTPPWPEVIPGDLNVTVDRAQLEYKYHKEQKSRWASLDSIC